MVIVSRRTRRRLRSIVILLLISLFIAYSILPHDSAIRLAFVFNFSRFFNFLRGAATDRDAWLRKSPRYSVDLKNDVGYLIKTGYGTRHRVPEQLAAFEATGGYLGKEGESFLVVGDWTMVNQTDAKLIGVTVHDAIKRVMETKVRGKIDDYPRLVKYRSLQARLQAGDEEEALKIGQSYGWELDALKFIMGMEMIYKELPRKKWYIILDDDTFLIRPSLELLMGHLDYRKPQYVGNAVGDYKARFGHGGSGILISGEAMRRLFQHPGIVQEAYAESMTETWGDRLVATTLQKLGIYIEEAYNHHFNGEPPSITRIWGDRFCSPLLSFHGLRKPGEMRRVGERLAKIDKPVRWHDVWEMFGGSAMSALESRPTELTADHVGKPDEHTRSWGDVRSANACKKRCEQSGRRCLAWTYEMEIERCHTSPWLLLGADGATGKASGVNWPEVKPLLNSCRS
ncbi:glycosyltransferase family 31 [Fusarium austroafricanum]|uniref:Glycosyltransferase family 31 n=1 Tax=Fusarium austroafricanum TaxID=2364996 RepID=A0A8H4PAL6_9HYPO|nr:glycosyltransferase family 31 [Fusarium austroafricanum]